MEILSENIIDNRFGRWHDAVRTLGKIHRTDVFSTGLETFGKSSNFYHRQIATFIRMNDVQSKAIDVETKQPVGTIPFFDDIVSFLKDQKLQPRDRWSLVHGDFKMDNIVFHKSEPSVIGVLE